ncbi:deoxyguanosinetriphosphate triphosphohydrolase [Denitratisoma oestradiolicum]|uniref:Deoxyguanosinetriphosphate triphosphohydrolase-like protein n=1 Tax=Denitratisoma oestradiolicum TaxID=311182 RepID=A0A6S6Y3G3_9PROT|nr:deoxyguanosinetriphosphate triphosphohydrolase [Denitratisoma oestradiolicum]TWO80020.1 deoxyguanosinetriphosphate triphosphohydrolase [Denitratisoma oestradiolicum]CAB1369788.1 Deoxyguanosinetriphosphate triphosphohydrolase-like protein [Denitratisoma oestradiolicum]
MGELAAYAVSDAVSRGRVHGESPPKFRSEFQRDRDRIVHSTAFRRLEYKTQVFVNHEGDLFRTRLTHSIEVAQIARTIARALGLNDDLAEAVSLSHDLGHTPFGHAGQDALNACMAPHGGFEHNLQSLRIVDRLEERYGGFDGLNLMFETREGILKHCSPAHARQLGDLGARFMEDRRPSIEAQICNLADEIAYNNHDLDDGLRSGLISLTQLDDMALFSRYQKEARLEFPDLAGRRLIHETIRRMIGAQVTDLMAETRRRIAEVGVLTLDDVHRAPVLVGFSPAVAEENRQLKAFLRDALYRHYQVLRMTNKARRIIADLFDAFIGDLRLLPPQYQRMAAEDGPRAIADYIAGMTDRYAIKEHRRLFAVGEI